MGTKQNMSFGAYGSQHSHSTVTAQSQRMGTSRTCPPTHAVCTREKWRNDIKPDVDGAVQLGRAGIDLGAPICHRLPVVVVSCPDGVALALAQKLGAAALKEAPDFGHDRAGGPHDGEVGDRKRHVLHSVCTAAAGSVNTVHNTPCPLVYQPK